MPTGIAPTGLAWTATLRKYGAGVRVIEHPPLAISNITPTQILTGNPDRVFWLIQNNSFYYGVIAFNDLVTLTTGILISGAGGFVISKVDEDGEGVTYPIWGLESAPGVTWYVMEIAHQ